MNVAKAAAIAQKKLKGVTDRDEKIRIVNEVIQLLAEQHQYYVRCPLTGLPLIGVNITNKPNLGGEAITYHIPQLRAKA